MPSEGPFVATPTAQSCGPEYVSVETGAVPAFQFQSTTVPGQLPPMPPLPLETLVDALLELLVALLLDAPPPPVDELDPVLELVVPSLDEELAAVLALLAPPVDVLAWVMLPPVPTTHADPAGSVEPSAQAPATTTSPSPQAASFSTMVRVISPTPVVSKPDHCGRSPRTRGRVRAGAPRGIPSPPWTTYRRASSSFLLRRC
jgi:hypothetical protein